jgi:hypothetical protein
MTQLVMRTLDVTTGEFVAAYTVCVGKGQVLVQAMDPGWTEAARRVQAALNAAVPKGPSAAEGSVQR